MNMCSIFRNIYLDIDGVLLINEKFAAPYAEDFLKRVLEKYPNSTYWLTTHRWRGIDRTQEVLTPAFSPEALELVKAIKPTEWGEFKTDAIDFSQPFMWFDDDLFPEEKAVLEAHGALDSWVGIDLAKDPNQLQHLAKQLFA
jgi:hypothetical protein